MWSIQEVADFYAVSKRTLRYFEELGLLVAVQRNEAGYREYSEANLGQVQTILFFREMGFPLKQIKALMERSDFDLAHEMAEQK